MGDPSFQASDRFAGPREGFIFTTGAQGTGYYRDAGGEDYASLISKKRGRSEIGLTSSSSLSSSSSSSSSVLTKSGNAALDTAASQNFILDPASIRSLCSSVATALLENAQKRFEFERAPAKFMASEVALHNALSTLIGNISSEPKLFPELVRNNLADQLGQLVLHSNLDIAKDALTIITELVDPEVASEAREEALLLVDHMFDGGVIDAIIANLERLNLDVEQGEEDQARCIYLSMDALEGFIEARGNRLSAHVVKNSALLTFLLDQIKRPAYDANKLYCSEILSSLLSTFTNIRQAFAGSKEQDVQNMDSLLMAAAVLRDFDPDSLEQEECVANVFSALASALVETKNKQAFNTLDGMELLVGIIKSRHSGYPHALKALVLALEENPKGCVQFIDVAGLSVLFPLFMGRGLKVKSVLQSRKRSKGKKEVELIVSNATLAIVASLFAQLMPPTETPPYKTPSIQYRRLLRKFEEEGQEKTDRVVEQHLAVMDRLQLLEDLRAQGKISEEEFYLEKVDAGADHLQNADIALAHLFLCTEKQISHRVTTLLQENARTLDSVRKTLAEYAADLPPELFLKQHVQSLVKAF